MEPAAKEAVLDLFAAPVRAWFEATFEGPTAAQTRGWPPIARGDSTLLLAPTGSGKTLSAFLAAIDRLMFHPTSAELEERLRVLYISPLKALAVDVERNLRAPLVGIAAAAQRLGVPFREPVIAIRSGDTSQRDRAQLLRHGADILITTPESLYLLLTSQSRKLFASVETVIIDEIHAVVGTKRGSHLLLCLERLEAIRKLDRPLQRIGLSATQRPLELVARTLGGSSAPGVPRPVEMVDAGARRAVEVTIEVPVDDMRALGESDPRSARRARGADKTDAASRSIWPSIHPQLLELIRAHRTTMIFVNNRRLSERLAGALNELAGEEVALAHHGSIAQDKRREIEERLKAGAVPAIVATSSLELGIDMGTVDLVVQIEAPPSVAAGLQRVGRAGHRAGAVSKGVIVPKFRGDLLTCAATAAAMREAEVESTSVPENPLDVLAQQVVAIVSMDPIHEAALYDMVRCAAPYATLPRSAYEGVLDMLSGRYPSDDFAELRPRIVWDRVTGQLTPRHGARRLAVLSGGTIPDRGLYGVFLAGTEEGKPVRVGELDEEMVFESRVGEVFLLGASSWRIEEITHDRVLVSPAPGEPGKMPFWRGDRPGRPAELGRRIGQLARKIAALPAGDSIDFLQRDLGLDARASKNLTTFIHEQKQATSEVPSDTTIVVERFRDELGATRVCVLSPFGSRVLAPWAMAVTTKLRETRGLDIEVLWTDDGIVFRVPEGDDPPGTELFVPSPDEVEELVLRGLDKTALFASRFRENAARALLLPRRAPGKRSPLWAQRKRASDLLAVASKYGSFPMVLETYRECLRDVLDMPALVDLLRRIRDRSVRVLPVDTASPSPFASGLLFSYVASFIYDGDAPLAERRAQALSLDQDRLRELLGDVELRELLDEEAIRETEAVLQHLSGRKVRHLDALHDLLLSIGDLDEAEIALRTEPEVDGVAFARELCDRGRILRVSIAGVERFIAAEDMGRVRDALGVVPRPGVPAAFLEPVADALPGLASRYARTHGPFTVDVFARRYGLGVGPAKTALASLVTEGRVVAGTFLPSGRGEELCDAEVLRTIKRRSLARLRREIEPVDPPVLARFLGGWHGIGHARGGLDALLTVLEQLEGCALSMSVWLEDVLPARIDRFRPSDVDDLCAAGEIVWRGVEPLGQSDGRVAFFLSDRYRLMAPPAVPPTHTRAQAILEVLERRGAVFFGDLVTESGGFIGDILDGLWDLVWCGVATNDTTLPLRSMFKRPESTTAHGRARAVRFRSRRALPAGSEGRWTLLPGHGATAPSETDRRTALANVLLARHGVVTREVAQTEGVPGGFSAVYPVLKLMEESGRIRRGYFVAGLGAVQFARPGVDDRLRACRDPGEKLATFVLAATDPANPYGSAIPWPPAEPRPQRVPGAHVILVGGALVGYLARGDQALTTFLPEEEPDHAAASAALVAALSREIDLGERDLLVLTSIDAQDATSSALLPRFLEAGFVKSGKGLLRRREGSFARAGRRRG